MELSSRAFDEGGEIPWRFAAPGLNEIPPLEIAEVPENAASLALILENLDSPVGALTHWLVWNIPPDTRYIDSVSQPMGWVRGRDAFGKLGYTGPAPPEGRQRFRFILIALDCELSLPAGANRERLDTAIQGHELERAVLEGYSQRPDEA